MNGSVKKFSKTITEFFLRRLNLHQVTEFLWKLNGLSPNCKTNVFEFVFRKESQRQTKFRFCTQKRSLGSNKWSNKSAHCFWWLGSTFFWVSQKGKLIGFDFRDCCSYLSDAFYQWKTVFCPLGKGWFPLMFLSFCSFFLAPLPMCHFARKLFTTIGCQGLLEKFHLWVVFFLRFSGIEV